MTNARDFFEEDEPVADVLAAYEQGEKGVTARSAGQVVSSSRFLQVFSVKRSVPRDLTAVQA